MKRKLPTIYHAILRGLWLGSLNFMYCLCLTINTRSTAQGNYIITVIMNFLLSIFAFTIVKTITQSKTLFERLSYASGSVLAGIIGIMITKVYLGK